MSLVDADKMYLMIFECINVALSVILSIQLTLQTCYLFITAPINLMMPKHKAALGIQV